MRFVETKTPEQQSCLMLHRTRHLFIRQQTAVINAIRAHLAEFGIVAPVGRNGVEELLGVVADASDRRLPEIARACLAALGAQLRMLKAQILEFDHMIYTHCAILPNIAAIRCVSRRIRQLLCRHWWNREGAVAPSNLPRADPALYFAEAGNAGNLSTSRASCWMTTVALEPATIFLTRSSDASVCERSVLKAGTPLVS